ncbi:unnamed protein product [Staurois parvus]|uniref:Uncharacterized protein n=1 Tax=Staurois parvus TaxID=386267 RepID=A0ABN9CXP7_9NEOB|nr:unnamed protein product [Staurois parvus]
MDRICTHYRIVPSSYMLTLDFIKPNFYQQAQPIYCNYNI